jgi:hypothetical protein
LLPVLMSRRSAGYVYVLEDGMTRPAARAALLGLFALTMAFALAPRIGQAPGVAVAQSVEVFTQVLPQKVYSEIPSHPGDADANPTLGLNGYCVDVAAEGPVSIGGNLGFEVTNGAVIDTDFFNNGSSTTTDDVYCATVVADRITDQLPRPDMIVRWNYVDGGSTAQATLNVRVVTVTLIGFDGYVGIPAQVCTEGWDPLFLTGFNANNPPSAPNILDEVVGGDWTTDPVLTPGVFPAYRDGSGPEWCVPIYSDTALNDVDVTLSLWALYNPLLETDDHLVTETVEDVVSFDPLERPELRHITTLTPDGEGGQVDGRRATTPNVIGAMHTACVLPSVPADTLMPDNIQFISPNGAIPANISVFHSTVATVPGVPDNTKCFTWTSRTPGYQEVFVNMIVSAANPLPDAFAGPTFASWDTNGDGNDGLGPGSGLLKYWNTIDYTVINQGGDWDDESTNITNSSIDLPMVFNVANGTYLASISLTEWVIGSRPGPDGSDGEPIDGVPVRLEILSNCAYFGEGPAGPKVVDTVTTSGRVEFDINIEQDVACNIGSLIELRITASYPPGIDAPAVVDVETLTIRLVFQAAESSPIIAWAGMVVTLNYGFAGNCDNAPVIWLRESGAGTFLADGFEDDPDAARTALDDNCESIVQFASEVPGEVVIEAQIVGNARSKVVFPIFFMAFEDFALSVQNQVPSVSEITTLGVNVRGWFVGANPSGRPAVTLADGRSLPQDRWVLPDDWATLRGPDDFRPGWPSSPSLPPTPVTFFMENEGVTNSYKAGVKNGALGWFLIDPETYAHNYSPTTRVPSVLGSEDRPRIITKLTDDGGFAEIEVFGDLNHSFEECPKNLPTGNPHCDLDDIVGRTTYFAIVDYPESVLEHRGKFPPVRSNNGTKTFHWEGYKRVTWQPGATPGIRYVVAHLKDRDGFCNAINWHNTLGVKVQFAIDSADGIITQAADRPYVINNDGTRKFANVTTFDTVDDNGTAMNASIVKVVQEQDECQAWIRIDNSLGEPVDVHVTFSPPPAPVPGKLRISSLFCTGPYDFVEITNIGDSEVSLAGFALRSGNSSVDIVSGGILVSEEHLGLEGHLKPGETKIFYGDNTLHPWVDGSKDIFTGTGDYARIVWEEQTVAFRGCGGAPEEFTNLKFPSDGEGTIELDIIVPFADRQTLPLSSGWNLVSIGGGGISLEEAFSGDPTAVEAVYTFDDTTGAWLKYIPGLPDQAVTITTLEAGKVYWVMAKRPFTMLVPR